MTLSQWSTRHAVTIHRAPAGFRTRVFTDDALGYGARWELWHLDDYIVSSVISGPAVSLVPRVVPLPARVTV